MTDRCRRSSPTRCKRSERCASRFTASASALMMATALHAIATGNLLPAWVKVACVDINPATVTKLTDRGSIQTVGVVTDAEPFLRALVAELAKS